MNTIISESQQKALKAAGDYLLQQIAELPKKLTEIERHERLEKFYKIYSNKIKNVF